VEIVKVRRVGNSNVITLPRELQNLGFTEGVQVVVEATPEGDVRLIPVSNLREAIRASGRKVARQHREALEILSEAEGASHAPEHTPTVAD
jgi:antitoxin component of MazEF toxin-antitoxin module